jgi:peptidylprolyl isomerase
MVKRLGCTLILTLITLSTFGHTKPTQSYPAGLYAQLKTNKGDIIIRLEYQKTPMTVANFVGLAEGNLSNQALSGGKAYFNGSLFHRVVPKHVIQAGIPKTEGRFQGPGYQFPNEIHPTLSHNKAGMVGMANSGPHTNGSQFYITLSDRSYLDGDYTVFGQVISGMKVIYTIRQNDPIISISIIRVGSKARAFKPTDQTFHSMVEKAKAEILRATAIKHRQEESFIKRNWPNATKIEKGIQYVVQKPGAGPLPGPGMRVKTIYRGQRLKGAPFGSTPTGHPDFKKFAQPFIYTIGKSSLNPGLDWCIEHMKKGEKRILILPSHTAYGIRGFYGAQRQGAKRFVISPNTLLVYAIEILDILK